MEEDHVGSNPGQSHVVQARPNPKLMHEDFMATIYPQVHESLKLTTDDHVHIENLPSLSGILSSMKNLGDAFTFGDQFLNDKPSEEEPASSLVPPLSTLIIDLTPPKLVYPLAQEPIFTPINTTTTTTLPLPPLPQQQSTTDPKLANHIDKYVNEVVKEAVHNTLQAPIRERFRDLSEFEMKEILHDRMSSMKKWISLIRDVVMTNIFLHLLQKTLTKARMKCHDLDAVVASKQPLVHKSSAWKTSDTREAPSSSSKQKFDSLSKQPVDDVPIPDDVHLLDSKDTGVAHHLKIKTRLGWLKPLPEEEAPETLKPDWVIPPNDLPEIENNWGRFTAKTYKDQPEENKLLRQAGSDPGKTPES
ncbi:hypothetical protein Tco_0453818 [Tanacetum coccineum]